MSSSDDDDFYCGQYSLNYYKSCKGPPIIDKKSRLFAAVVQNQIEILQELLDSPEWYTITEKSGINLLQVAIVYGHEKIFDYLMSVPDFPIETVTKRGDSTLALAFDFDSNSHVGQHFVYELIKRGASLDVVSLDGLTWKAPLHVALEKSYNEVALLLIQKGVNLNVPTSCGHTPLELALEMSQDPSEVVTALLINGATPSEYVFESAIVSDSSDLIQGILFNYLFDEYSEIEVGLDVFLHLAKAKSPLFYELLKCPVIVKVKARNCPYFRYLCSIDIDYLNIIVKKFAKQIKQGLAKCEKSTPAIVVVDKDIFIRNLNFMLESDIADISSAVILYISTLDSFKLLLQLLLYHKLTESAITKFYCFLLSYGLTIDESDLLLTYKHFGYCELFKILLHMDWTAVNKQRSLQRSVMPVLIYDISIDLDHFLDNPEKYVINSVDDFKDLCHYFAHPRLKQMCLRGDSQIPNLPDVPLLTELARNAFRKYFIELFEIKTSRKFYTLLTSLPISRYHKKIISYETKLYEST